MAHPTDPALRPPPIVRCPRCGSGQFALDKQVTVIGKVLAGFGIAVVLLSVPLLLLGGFGICTLPIGGLLLLGLLLRTPVRRCMNCRLTF